MLYNYILCELSVTRRNKYENDAKGKHAFVHVYVKINIEAFLKLPTVQSLTTSLNTDEVANSTRNME